MWPWMTFEVILQKAKITFLIMQRVWTRKFIYQILVHRLKDVTFLNIYIRNQIKNKSLLTFCQISTVLVHEGARTQHHPHQQRVYRLPGWLIKAGDVTPSWLVTHCTLE